MSETSGMRTWVEWVEWFEWMDWENEQIKQTISNWIHTTIKSELVEHTNKQTTKQLQNEEWGAGGP